MPEPLLICLQRHIKDPKAFGVRLAGRAVLLYEPPEEKLPTPLGDDEPQDSAAFRFRTASGVTDPAFGSGEEFHTSPSKITIGEIVANGAAVEFFSRNLTINRCASTSLKRL